MKAGPSHTEMRELSEIIVEINDLREFALDPDRPEQNRWRFNFSPLAAHPIPKYQRAKAPKRFNESHRNIVLWEHNNFLMMAHLNFRQSFDLSSVRSQILIDRPDANWQISSVGAT